MAIDNSNAPELYKERVDSAFKQIPIILWADIIAGSLLALIAIFIADTDNTYTFYWLGALTLVVAVNFVAASHLRKLPLQSQSSQRREQFMALVAVLSGLLWGSTWVIAPYAELFEAPRGAILMFPAAMLASAVINLSTIKKLFFYFAVPMIVCHVAFSLYQGTARDLQIAFMFPVVFLFSSVLATRVSHDLNQTIKLKLQNQKLNSKLSSDEAILKQREAELQTRIEREAALLLEKKSSDSKLHSAVKEKLLLLDAVSEGIFGINSAGNISFVNTMTLNFLHFEESTLLDKSALNIFCDKSPTSTEMTARDLIISCLAQGESVQNVSAMFCGNDDMMLPVRFSCRPITEEGILTGAVVSFLDMTKQIDMEARLLQSQKMEAIGRITGGVAHDFNNLLTVIMGNLQFLKRRLSNDGRVGDSDLVETLIKASKNGAELNKRLLSFSREQALQSKPEDINNLLLDMKKFLGRALGENIDFTLDLCDEPCTVEIDHTQFENVLLNLCVNARDAMPTGGKLSITSSRIWHTDTLAPSTSKAKPQEYIEITLKDNGAGIPAEIQDKIFDPFFTTKPMGEGSGFGLSTAFGFLHQSGGTITVKSREGEWTIFTLRIPFVEGVSAPKNTDEQQEHREQYSGTILVVEDDSGVRNVATQMLLESGFRVIAANDGHSGLEHFNLNPEIDLVFSDIMMPGGMTGIDMAKLILENKPDTPILLATGYTEKILKESMVKDFNVTCISKPYDTDSLPSLINSMLS